MKRHLFLVAMYGANEWANDPGAGMAGAVFVKDSVFVGNRHAIASNAGAHYVFRHNRVQESVQAWLRSRRPSETENSS